MDILEPRGVEKKRTDFYYKVYLVTKDVGDNDDQQYKATFVYYVFGGLGGKKPL